MKWLKQYFAVIFLFVSCLAVGIIALVTALRVRELRTATPPQTQALTPPCSLTFVINDTTPREIENEPTKIAEILITPTLTPLPTPTSIPATPTLFPPTPTLKPTATPTPPSLTPTPTATYGYGSYPNPTLTPTPALITQTKITSTPTPTLLAKPLNQIITPTVIGPELPVSGISLPTWLIVIVGLVFLTTARFLFLREK